MAGLLTRLKRGLGFGDPAAAEEERIAAPAAANEREDVAARLAVDRLNWLLDAPLFINEPLVERLFDAVARPEFEVHSRVVGELNEEARSRLIGGEASATYKGGLSFLTGSIEAGGKLKHERGTTTKTGRSTSVTEQRVNTPGRKLEELALVYLNRHPERIVFIRTTGEAQAFSGESLNLADLKRAARDPPRMLAFVELAPGSKLMPMACELQTGETVRLFETYKERLWPDVKVRPDEPNPDLGKEEGRAAWHAYWVELASKFDSVVAMELVEDAGKSSSEGHGRIGWINFRVPIGADDAKSEAMHLNLVPDGKYHAGVFGYNFARRGFNQGVRLVGTLRSGLGLNVIAVFDT